MYVKRNTDARSRNHCCGGKAISITYSERVFSLNYSEYKAHASIIFSSVDSPSLPDFSVNGKIFWKGY